jgi:hypothetical protein
VINLDLLQMEVILKIAPISNASAAATMGPRL